MTHSAPATVSHSFRPYQQSSSAARHSSYHPTSAASYYEHDAPQHSHQLATTAYRRRVDESKLSVVSASVSRSSAAGSAASSSAPSSSSSSSFSPLSLCSSVSSCSSSSSGSSSSAYSSPADTFDLEEMGEDGIAGHSMHHTYFHHPPPQQHHRHPKQPTIHQQQVAVKSSRPLPQSSQQLAHHQPLSQDTVYYSQQAVTASPSLHSYGHNQSPPPSMTVSIPSSNGGWKETANGVVRRRETQLLPQAHQLLPAELPAYLPAPMQPVVAAAAEVVSDGKSSGNKKKGRSLRRCMDREKHSRAEQKRRGEMKQLFDQLQDISQCVYKDRIHILTLAIQTIQRQQDTIGQLQSQVGKGRNNRAVKKEQASADPNASVEVSGYSSPSSSVDSSVGSKRAAVAAELDCQSAAVVKQEDEAGSNSPKKQRTSPQPRTVVDLSNDAAFSASLPPIESSTVSSLATSYVASKSLHNSFSSSSLSTFVCPSTDVPTHYSWGLDEQPHAPYHTAQHVDEPAVSKSQLASHATANVAYPTPGMSPVFSFTAHPQHWWPSTVDSAKQ